MLIVRSYWTLTRVFRSRKVSGRRHERISPAPVGTVAVRGSGIDKGQTQWPTSLLDVVPCDGDGSRGVSIDFAHMGTEMFRKTKESCILDPVIMRPVTCKGY